MNTAPAAEEHGPATGEDEPPPILGSWWRLYALVIGALALYIALLAWLTGHFR